MKLLNYPSDDEEFNKWFEATNDPETVRHYQVEARKYQIYNELIDLTENKDVLFNERSNLRLSTALELMEYLLGNDDESPLELWFGIESHG